MAQLSQEKDEVSHKLAELWLQQQRAQEAAAARLAAVTESASAGKQGALSRAVCQ